MALNFGQSLFPQSSQIFLNYDYSDIASGTGFVNYYTYTTKDTSATAYHLTSDTVNIYSTEIEQTALSSDDTQYVKVIDKDFDLSAFNMVTTIRGTGIIRFTVDAGRFAGSGSGNGNSYVIVRVRKWDGTTETEIASAQSPTQSGNGGGGESTVLMPITIPRTVFQKGQQLRVTIEGWLDAESGTNSYLTIGSDPQNRDGSNIVPSGDASGLTTTRFIIKMPFELKV